MVNWLYAISMNWKVWFMYLTKPLVYLERLWKTGSFTEPDMTYVTYLLFLGGYIIHWPVGVKRVLNMAIEFKDPPPPDDTCRLMNEPQVDLPPYPPVWVLDRLVLIINEWINAGHLVYVHCAEGNHRSATVVIAYMMRIRGFTLDEAMVFVDTMRPGAVPHKWQITALREYERLYCSP